LQQQGAAQVILDAELTGARLYEVLEPLLRKPELLQQQAACSRALGRPQAADAIVTTCLHLLGSTTVVAPSPSGEGFITG
jgi:UDP-N-acetylglucosamine--N-acetylmuramyl-(pentapeptide) pyrophosphoryl-undecaprenol N-acetylglucosamine transferase